MPSENGRPNRHSHGSGNLGRGVWATVLSDKFPCGQVRIPACAGMTGFEIAVLSAMAVRVFPRTCPAPVNGERVKNAV
ncbi:Uncharacterised protein [Neisseria gonorrhoeae]|nr:Uncharacterised protein [Neisseria gonorrhoeae]